MRNLLYASVLLGLTDCAAVDAQIVQPLLPTATVISTGDGDTLRLRQSGEAVTVRLACIDAPEKNQPGGQESASRLRELLSDGQAVTVREVDGDRYGRLVAEVYVDGASINLQMVTEGHAVVYDRYLSGCVGAQDQYLASEQFAMANNLNFWSQTKPVMPWDWRQGVVVAEPEPVGELPDCVSSDCDCGDFSSQAEAQEVLEAVSGDPHSLDRDGDGVACESLH